MSLLDDILKSLDRWDEWRRMRGAPTRLDALEQRLERLEAQIGGRAPGESCPKCGRATLRVMKSDRVMGKGGYERLRSYRCEGDGCDFTEQRQTR